MIPPEKVIEQTKKWIADIVVGCNFCPFAGKELKQNTIRYTVEISGDASHCLQLFMKECILLDEDESVITTMIIFPVSYLHFDKYLDLVSLAEELLIKEGYEGIYQVASFHPLYQFAGTTLDDPSNYTNRSIYPMLHILREDSIEEALKKYPDAGKIPGRNINFAREKGLVYMKMLRDACI